MGCLDADTVLAWIDGQLSTERASAVEAHIEGCAACRRLITYAPVTCGDAAPAEPRSRSRIAWLAGALAIALVAVAVGWAAWPRRAAPRPAISRLIEARGQILTVRRGPDGLYFDAAFGEGIAVDGAGAV